MQGCKILVGFFYFFCKQFQIYLFSISRLRHFTGCVFLALFLFKTIAIFFLVFNKGYFLALYLQK